MAYLLPQLLSESAAADVEHIAVQWADRSLTYGQLDAQSNQVARVLRDLDVSPGDRVGIYLTKSFASIVSVFGIMKAGAAFVPLDPKTPAARLGYISRNCDVKVLLSSAKRPRKLAELLREAQGIENLILMGEEKFECDEAEGLRIRAWHEVISAGSGPVKLSITDTDLAYILYTSGSTGTPKGVMISHRTILTFINWACKHFGISKHDRVTSHAPLHFDLSTFDIYATIKAGGTIVLVPESYSLFPTQLSQLLQDESVTIIYMVPSMLSQLVSSGNLADRNLLSLREVVFAGEVFPIKYLRQLAQAVPQANYTNLYGPTETNVCTYYEVRKQDLIATRDEPVPIGIACENIEVFSVDDRGNRIQERGVKGELWVRGNCVAKGYWGDPDKTARNFVKNIYQPHFDEVAYRTGDVVYLDEDDNYVYCGRRDHMVKVRGHRVELGEIETVLNSNAQISEVAVVPVPDELSGNLIKAFVVPTNGAELTETRLKKYCGTYLPRYMIPDSVTFLDTIPKTSSGKIDRKGLAQRATGRANK